MDALIQALADINSKDGERFIAANPASCQVCNDCEGWENEKTTSKRRTFEVNEWPTPGFEIRTGIRTLEDAANGGCPTCKVFLSTIIVYLPAIEDDLEVRVWLPMPRGSLPVLWVKAKGVEDDKSGFKVEFFTTPDAPAPWPIFRPGKLYSEDTSSNASQLQALEWLQNCLDSHRQCQSNKGLDVELPTRILDVGAPGEHDPQVRLYESRGETGSYVALSHCWGKSQMIKTEHDSLSLRKEGIAWDILPKSFQDAITFVRRLSLRYLWIDSICIIQDSKLDWEAESAKMASIYANSILTIAATKSSDSSGGCFSNVPDIGRTRKIVGISKDGKEFAVYARSQVRNWENSPLPLYSRAWCFQERILSPRVLHFEYHELKWECNAITAHESKLAITSHDEEKANRLGRESDPHSMNDRWRRMVREYVDLDLTYESDRLPALSGLAKHIQMSYRRGKYLAGLWGDSLFEDLMWWVREEDVQDTCRPKSWRAPSWSWASLEGRIQHRILPIKATHCTVVDAQVTAAGTDPTGAVALGRLVISGTILPAILRIIQAQSDTKDGEPEQKCFKIEVKGKTESRAHRMYVDYQVDVEGPGRIPDGQNVFCLCVATDQWHKCWMVLRKTPGEHGSAYERIGMAWQSHAQIKDGKDWASLVNENTTVSIL